MVRSHRLIRPERRALVLAAMIGVILVLSALVVVLHASLQPTNAPAVTTEGDPPVTVTGSEARLLALVNSERGLAKCPALRPNAELTQSARAHAADMADRAFASTINPDQVGPDARAQTLGYEGDVTEIVAVGLPTATDVITQWTNPQNEAAGSVLAKMIDCSRVSVGVAHLSARAKPTFGQGIWVMDLGDA
jgi:hypothetical protein